MPWKKGTIMSAKEEFLFEISKKQQTVSHLCKSFGISRKTGYKWITRYEENGLEGLLDHSKRPLVSPRRSSEEDVEMILAIRDKHPEWSGRKLRQCLVNEGKTDLPCERTFARILKSQGRISLEATEKCAPWKRFERAKPNELWQMDFKGHFQVDEGRCHPLTLLDDHSRFSLCIKACLAETEVSVRSALEDTFRTYGLPDGMTMDNGSPWKGSPPFRLSKLTVWLMRLGIKVSHSAPYHPQTQGKLERFHRSFKAEVLKYNQLRNLEHSQEKFDEWREIYNNIRPHEGIDLKCPIDRYIPSVKKFPDQLPSLEYLEGDLIRKVGICGTVKFYGKNYFLGEHLQGEYVGARVIGDGIIDVYFSTTKIQRILLKNKEHLTGEI